MEIIIIYIDRNYLIINKIKKYIYVYVQGLIFNIILRIYSIIIDRVPFVSSIEIKEFFSSWLILGWLSFFVLVKIFYV